MEEPHVYPVVPLAVFKNAIRHSIQLWGAGQTYHWLKLQLEPQGYHLGGHIFGEVLYEVVGKSGVVVCDSALNYGCFHGFATMAISHSGVTVVHQLMDVCNRLTGREKGNCIHGLGHGVGAYFGPNRLSEQFEFCRAIEPDTNGKDCVGGAIMQYFEYYDSSGKNGNGSGYANRPYDQNNPYSPCPEVPAAYINVCYRHLAGWWWDVHSSHINNLDQLCHAIPLQASRNACYLGLGTKIAQVTQHRSEAIISLCQQLSQYETQKTCFIGAAVEVAGFPGDQNQARIICDALMPVDSVRCQQEYLYQDNKANGANAVPK